MVELRVEDVAAARAVLRRPRAGRLLPRVGAATRAPTIAIQRGERHALPRAARGELRAIWSDTTFRMQALRDDPECAAEEQAAAPRRRRSRPSALVPFDPEEDVAAPFVAPRRAARGWPSCASRGSTGRSRWRRPSSGRLPAGRRAHERHPRGPRDLRDVRGLAACGGFSYGDVLGAGEGWAKSILLQRPRARRVRRASSPAPDTFALGVCNGCQMMSNLRALIPGAEHWPRFVRNRSERFEARLAMVRIEPSPSVLLRGHGGRPAAHRGRPRRGPGRVRRRRATSSALERPAWWPPATSTTAARSTERYPFNPNGSPARHHRGHQRDGRVTILMPHPERVFRAVQYSWRPRPGWKTAPGCACFATRAGGLADAVSFLIS